MGWPNNYEIDRGFVIYMMFSFFPAFLDQSRAMRLSRFEKSSAHARTHTLRQQVLPVSFILRCESCLARVRPGPIWSAVSFFPPSPHTCLPIISNGAPIGDNGRERARGAPLGPSLTERKSNDKSNAAAVADYDIASDSGTWRNTSPRKSPLGFSKQCLPTFAAALSICRELRISLVS